MEQQKYPPIFLKLPSRKRMGATCVSGKVPGCSRRKSIVPENLTDEEIDMMCATADFKKDEIFNLYQGFKKDCPDGYLTKKRLHSFYNNLCADGDAKKFVDAAFRVFDTNRDGRITFNEFVTAMSFLKSSDLEKQLGIAFDLFDLDKDRYVTKIEIIKLLNAVYDMKGLPKHERTGELDPKRKAEKIILMMDKSGDGKISKEEFLSTCQEDESICKLFASTVIGRRQ
ncbi:hypothetical protein ACOME3_007815 [Neoechinorhynchus agilis]